MKLQEAKQILLGAVNGYVNAQRIVTTARNRVQLSECSGAEAEALAEAWKVLDAATARDETPAEREAALISDGRRPRRKGRRAGPSA